MPEADNVYDVESNMGLSDMVSLILSGGVCVVSMHEIVQSRNLGDPKYSFYVEKKKVIIDEAALQNQ
ncbi:MAG: hypothetical protein LN588_05845 [Rickettsia endosymbiont of Bryobia graminum]|nr:hypothetical protein [Rickettsia endosymbiont of Bryobia graminum]